MNNSKGKLVDVMAQADRFVRPTCKYGVIAGVVIAVASVLAPEKVAIVKALLFLGGS